MEQVGQIRECNNCDWVGWEWDCVTYKHLESVLLCPECYETTVGVTPERFLEVRDGCD